MSVCCWVPVVADRQADCHRAAGRPPEHGAEEAGTMTPELWVTLAVGVVGALGPVAAAMINRRRGEPPADGNQAGRQLRPDSSG